MEGRTPQTDVDGEISGENSASRWRAELSTALIHATAYQT